MYAKLLFVIVLSSLSIFFGVFSFAIGMLSSAQSQVWMAHTVSPLWSGAFFILCGLTGYALYRQRTQYSILCYGAINAITLIIVVVNMQLLRLGLVNYTTLGRTFQKEKKDLDTIIALVLDGGELVVNLLSFVICIKLNYDFKHNRFKTNRKEGAFFVQIVGEKDIVVVQSKNNSSSASHSAGTKGGLIHSMNTLQKSGVLI